MSRLVKAIAWSMAIASLLNAGACTIIGVRPQSPFASAREATVGPARLTPIEIQSEVMSFADSFTSAIAEEWNEVGSARRSAPAGEDVPADRRDRIRRVALEIKIANVSSVLSIASSPNPPVAVVDLITLITLQRMALEDPWAASLFGPQAAESAAQTYRAQERKIWDIGERVLNDTQQTQLRDLIAQWRTENPDQRYVSGVRLDTYGLTRRQITQGSVAGGGNLLSLLMLDPLAGLDPATREVQQSRMLGERLFYYASHLPQVLKWQGQSLAGSVLGEPTVREAVAAAARASHAADRMSAIAEQLPREREAALNQLFAGLAEQRAGLMNDLRDDDGRIGRTLTEVRATVETSRQLSESLGETIAAAQQLTAQFKSSDAESPPRSESDPNALDQYEAAAKQTTAAADQLTHLVTRVDELLKSNNLDRVTDSVNTTTLQFEESSRRLVDHIFWRAITTIIVAPFAIAGAFIVFHWVTGRRFRRHDPNASTSTLRHGTA